MARLAYTFVACLLLASCNKAQIVLEEHGPIRPAFLSVDAADVDSLLGTLTMEERIAQLLMVPIYSRTDTAGWSEAERWTRDLGLGGVICMQGGPEQQRIRLRRLQSLARIPLMVASDAEWGLGMRLDSTRSFPRAMTLGATRNEELVRLFGQVVGSSLRSTGVHVNFAPVVDVNSNPINPVIGSRSFGESVEWVAALGQAYADGLQDMHVLATAKHFPGHGDSDSDSHATLPTISHDRSRLDSIELTPFQQVFDAGVGAVMVAHLDIPGLDSTEAQPSTLSPLIVDSLLRKDMGFEGLVFTDAMSMKGFADFTGDRLRIRDAFLAGNDVLLFPGNPVEAIQETMEAIGNGTLDSTLIDAKCRRVLMAKAWTNAQEPLLPRGSAWEPVHAQLIHEALVAQSLTVLPCAGEQAAPFMANSGTVTMWDLANHATSNAAMADQLKAHLGASWTIDRHVLGKDGSGLGREAVRASAEQADIVLLTCTEMSHRPSRQFGLQPDGVEAVAKALTEWNVPAERVQVVWMGNPYALPALQPLESRCRSLLVAYQDDAQTCYGVADALASVRTVGGLLPVSAGHWNNGDGATWEGFTRLGRPLASRLTSWEHPSSLIDSLLSEALDAEATPGARVVVAHRGLVVMDKSVGSLDGSQPVTPESVYDLASITKVAATGMALMQLVDSGIITLDAPISTWMPELDGHDLGARTPRDMLAHQAGLESWIPFYLSAIADSSGVFDNVPYEGCDISISPSLFMEDAYTDTVWHMILDAELNEPGEYRYSDLGFYIWRKLFINLGLDLEGWFESSICGPMGWTSMCFNPLDRDIDPQLIAPSESDEVFRKGVVRGTVHDPGAAMQGGVGCHAGLFSNAYDLVELGEAWLRGGQLKGQTLSPPDILESWTARAFPEGDNRRGLVFDKPALEPDSGPTCDLASWESFGHTGFTGTLLWVDPAYDLVYVFLSNRTYPDADNTQLLKLDTRTEIQRVVLEHLGATSRFSNEL